MSDPTSRLIMVTGLSGAGKNSVLRALEDCGYEAVDNPPLRIIKTLIRTDKALAVGVDARTRDFSAADIVDTLQALRDENSINAQLLFLTAAPDVLQRRFTETRRRHPLAQTGTVNTGIETEKVLTSPLIDVADIIIDTSDLSLASLRQMIEKQFGLGGPDMAITLMSFSFPAGLPQYADLVFDTRFLKNPHYIDELRHKTGLDSAVQTYVRSDPAFDEFFERVSGLTEFLLPHFVREGKKYAMIAVGCTGGRHRSVSFVEILGSHLRAERWRVRVEHRSLEVSDFEINDTNTQVGTVGVQKPPITVGALK